MIIKCIAIDDEPLALDIIAEYCRKISFLNLEKTFDNAIDVIEYLKYKQIDLMFLDIQMEGLTGIQLLGVLQNRPKVIMTTAYESYAIRGYELDISDYLLKPISFERFTKAVNKVYENIILENDKKQTKFVDNHEINRENNHEINKKSEDYIFVKADAKLIKIIFDDILYIEGQGDYLLIVTTKGKVMTLQNFSNIQKSLPYPDFIRVHKSYIIPFNKIEKIDKNRIYIKEKAIPVSDTYKNELFKLVRSKEVK